MRIWWRFCGDLVEIYGDLVEICEDLTKIALLEQWRRGRGGRSEFSNWFSFFFSLFFPSKSEISDLMIFFSDLIWTFLSFFKKIKTNIKSKNEKMERMGKRNISPDTKLIQDGSGLGLRSWKLGKNRRIGVRDLKLEFFSKD